MIDDLDAAIAAVRADLRDEYLRWHRWPWVVGFSGGKDSTLVVHLVCELLAALPATRRREVHVVANDTLVESPMVIDHIHRVLGQIRASGLPVHVVTTAPREDHSFWVSMIGRGYPTPTRTFRWCTDRLKIQPTSDYIRRLAGIWGQVILVLGVRRDESRARAQSVRRYDNGQRLNWHNDIRNCLVYRPIADITTDQVWEFLATTPPPWGGTHEALIRLYRDAMGGECPVVTSTADVPSCGTTSARFGCWTCTVVDKDKSLEGLIESGYAEFVPLVQFREWLVAIRNEPNRRMARLQRGPSARKKDGSPVPGPFTFETRAEILARLLQLQAQVGRQLISPAEIATIHQIWAHDRRRYAAQFVTAAT